MTPITPEDPQVIPRAAAAQNRPARKSRPFLLSGIVGVMLVILVGGGLLASVGAGAGAGLFGNSESPDPAFDLVLPILTDETNVPVMLPAELPTAFENVGVDENRLDEDSYGVTFLSTPPDELVGSWGRYEIVGSLEAVPASDYEPDQGFEATSTEKVTLPDGTEAELSYMEPAVEGAMYGPQWKGTFNKNGYTYSLVTSDLGKENVEQALSTMVEVPE